MVRILGDLEEEFWSFFLINLEKVVVIDVILNFLIVIIKESNTD